jgi:hypothetical protein
MLTDRHLRRTIECAILERLRFAEAKDIDHVMRIANDPAGAAQRGVR